MPYATQQDLVTRYGEAELVELTDRAEEPTGEVDAGVVTAAIGDADRMIDGYIGNRYDLPLTATPALLTVLSCAIARYILHKDSSKETVRNNYEDALRQLRDLADGRMVLDVGGDEPAPAAGGVKIAGPDRVFSRTSLRGF